MLCGRAESTLLWAEHFLWALGFAVPHCHIQPRHVSLPVVATQELLISYLNAQMGDGEMPILQRMFLQLEAGQDAEGGLLSSAAGAH